MAKAAETRVSLLLRLRDLNDAEAWSQFAEIYSPLVFDFARRSGMQDSDASDLVQEVMGEVSKSIKRFEYDPQIGKFRSWLYKVAKRTAGHILKKQRRQPKGTGDSATIETLQRVPISDPRMEEYWDAQYQRQLLHWAAEQIRDQFQDSTWQAFWMTGVDGESPKAVADRLEISVGSVYVAKNRVLKKLRDKIREIDESQ